MKPIMDGKGIIAKLGNRELTRGELRRLPKGVKDRVRFYSEDGIEQEQKEHELDDDFFVSLNSGFIIAALDGRNLTADEYRELPDDVRHNKVIFNITEKGKNYPHLSLRDSINNIRGGVGWKDKKEFARDIGVPENRIGDLISIGLVKIVDNNYVIDNRNGNAMKEIERWSLIDKFFGKRASSTGWATKAELLRDAGIDEAEGDRIISKLVDKGEIEADYSVQKNPRFRLSNDLDIYGFLDGLNKKYGLDGAKVNVEDKRGGLYNALSGMVKGGIYEAIKTGWIAFMDDRTYTAYEWKNLSDFEQEKIGVRLTAKGRREIEDDNPLKIYDDLAKKKRNEGGLNLVKNIKDNNGEILLELTEEGERVKRLGIAMGIKPETVFKTMLNIGLDREMGKFMIIENGKIIDGSKRSSIERKSI